MTTIDLNCDLGEGAGRDAELMALISSANVACGGHAGDEQTMRETARLAEASGVAVGAHPGFADRAHFGRRELPVRRGEIRALVREQVARLMALATVRHVKHHGALYNLVARDPNGAAEVAEAVAELDANLILVGLAGSTLLAAGREAGLRVAGEAFADRTYQADGSLTPRGEPGALVNDPQACVAQVLAIARERRVRTRDGSLIRVEAQTVCLHGDGPHAVAFARRLRRALADAGVGVEALAP